jgi:hypothetical protein
MKNNKLMANLSRTMSKVVFKTKKHSPEILLATGIVGGIASAVLACKATTKIDEVIEEEKMTLEKIHGVQDGTIKLKEGAVYTDEDASKEIAITYCKMAGKMLKLYGPSLILGTLSVTSILASNNIIRKRSAAISAAYAALDGAFNAYRGRVKDIYGEEVDRQLRYGKTVEQIEVTELHEDGTETTTTKEVVSYDVNPNDYNKLFQEYNEDGSRNGDWTNDQYHNLAFLKAQESFATSRLQAQGYLLLNDVYEMIGMPDTKAGMVVGWIYDKNSPIGDNYVDFGLRDEDGESIVDFSALGMVAHPIPLDFNVDGNIYDRM